MADSVKKKKARLLGGVHLDHPGARERANGAQSRAYLTIDRGLKGGRLDEVDLSPDQLLRLIEDAASAYRIIKRENPGA